MARYATIGFQHVQIGLLGTEPAQLVERVVSTIVLRLASPATRPGPRRAACYLVRADSP
jgi:hypothetical protein